MTPGKSVYLKGKTKLIGTGVRDFCGESASRGDPAGESRGGSPTARGKRVPEVEINKQVYKRFLKKKRLQKISFH
jgi:hypothetical protein